MHRQNSAHDVIVQIKIKLLGVAKPPVWRRMQVRADTRLDQLHEVLQRALGWDNCHMHSFSFGDERYGLAHEFGDRDEREATLGELVGPGTRFRYTYDFGDDWEHQIVVEKLLDSDPDTHYPALLVARGACPPEDCGGAWCYDDLKLILADPNDDQHQERLDWLGLDDAGGFDPAVVDFDRLSARVAFVAAAR